MFCTAPNSGGVLFRKVNGPLQMHSDITQREPGGEVCVNVWSSVWAAVDVRDLDGVKLLGHL